jgi:hypothetical protein
LISIVDTSVGDGAHQLAVIAELCQRGGGADQAAIHAPVGVEPGAEVALAGQRSQPVVGQGLELLLGGQQVSREPGRQRRDVALSQKLGQLVTRVVGVAKTLGERRRCRGPETESQSELTALGLQLVDQLAHLGRKPGQVLDRAQRRRALRPLLRVTRHQRRQDERTQHRHTGEQDQLQSNRQSAQHLGMARRSTLPSGHQVQKA